jgi:hypothetical protein
MVLRLGVSGPRVKWFKIIQGELKKNVSMVLLVRDGLERC